MEDNKRKLYDALSQEYDLGSFDQFSADIADDTKRRKLYDATSEEYDYGDYDSFSKQLGFGVGPSRSTPEVGQVEQPARQLDPQAAAEGHAMFQAYKASRNPDVSTPADVPQATQQYMEQNPVKGGSRQREQLMEQLGATADDQNFIQEYDRRYAKYQQDTDNDLTGPEQQADKAWLDDNNQRYREAKQKVGEIQGRLNLMDKPEDLERIAGKKKEIQDKYPALFNPGGYKPDPSRRLNPNDPELPMYKSANEIYGLAEQTLNQGSKYDPGYEGNWLEQAWTAARQFAEGGINNIDTGSLTFGASEGIALNNARKVGDKSNEIVNATLKDMGYTDADANKLLQSVDEDGKKLASLGEELKKESAELSTYKAAIDDMRRSGASDGRIRPYAREYNKKISAYNKRVKSEWEPLMASYEKSANEYETLMSAIDSAVEGGLTDGEKALLDALEEFTDAKMKRAEDVSIASAAGAGAEQSAEFMLDFILTGGLAKAGTKAATKLTARRVMKKFGAEAAAKVVRPSLGAQIATDAVVAGARTAAMFPRNLAAYGEQLTQMTGKDNLGRYNFDRSHLNAALNTALTQYIEYWSEGFGEYFGAGEQALFRKVTKAAPRTAIGKTLGQYRGSIGKYLDYGKFDGMFNEMLEEVVGSSLNSLAGWMSGDRVGDQEAIKEFFSGEQLATLALSFLPMSAISASTNIRAYNKMKNRYNESVAVLNPFLDSGAISREELEGLVSNIAEKTPEEIKDSIVSIADKARAANGGFLPQNFTQSLMGYVEGSFAMSLNNETWEDSQEKIGVVNAYTEQYSNPDDRNAYDLAQLESEARAAAMQAGFDENMLDLDSYSIARHAQALQQSNPRQAQVLLGYAVAKAANQGLKDGYDAETRQLFDEIEKGIQANSVNGNVIRATAPDGNLVFITSQDASVGADGNLSTPTGADGLVSYVDPNGRTLQAKASAFTGVSSTPTEYYILDQESAFVDARNDAFDIAQQTISPAGMARALNANIGNTVFFRMNGIYEPIQVDRLTQGNTNVVVSGDPKFLNGLATMLGLQSPGGQSMELPIETIWPMLDTNDDGSLVTNQPEVQPAPTSAQPAATPSQPASEPEVVKPILIPEAHLGEDVEVVLDGNRRTVTILDVSDGQVYYEFEDENGDTQTRRLTYDDFMNAQDAAANPRGTQAPAAAPIEQPQTPVAEEAPEIKDTKDYYQGPGSSVDDMLGDLYGNEYLKAEEVDKEIMKEHARAKKALENAKKALEDANPETIEQKDGESLPALAARRKKAAEDFEKVRGELEENLNAAESEFAFWEEAKQIVDADIAERKEEAKREQKRQADIATYGVDISKLHDLDTPLSLEEAVAEYLGNSTHLINAADAEKEWLGKGNTNAGEIWRHRGPHGILSLNGGQTVRAVAEDIVGEYESLNLDEQKVFDEILNQLNTHTKTEMRDVIFQNRLKEAIAAKRDAENAPDANEQQNGASEEYGPVIRTYETKRGTVEVRTKVTEKDGVRTTKVVSIRNGEEVVTRDSIPIPDGYRIADEQLPDNTEVVGMRELREATDGSGRADATLVVKYDGVYSEASVKLERADTIPAAEEETIPASEAVEEAPEGTAVPEVEEPVAEPAEPEPATAEEDVLLENETQEIRDAVDAVVSGKDTKKREVNSTLPDDFTIGGMDANSYIRSRYDRFKAPLEKRREEIRKEYVAYRTRVEGEARADILRNNPQIKEDNPYLPDYVSEEANKRLKNDEQFNALDAQIKAIDDEIGNYQTRRYNALAAIEEIYESQKTAETPENNAPESSETPENSVPSQEEGGFQRPVFTLRNSTEQAQARNNFVEAVGRRLIFALRNGTEKPYRSITDLRKEARAWGLDVEDSGATDILLQELVELALVKAARALTEQNGIKSKNAFDQICRLYELQPTIGRRSSERVAMQQYSTPLPMSFAAQMFAYNGEMKEVLEPTAGNGMLVFGIPGEKVHANELDDTRNANLQALGFGLVSKQDATEPFGGKYDAVIANPPFGSHDAVEFDGKQISGLDPIITLRALDAMKDGGKAAIIIGGNVEFADNGAWKTKKAFFSYLYDHYNVKGVVNMAGDLYAKQGTTYPTMMILIDGRRSEEERAAGRVYPPTRNMAQPAATTYDELYDIVKNILNDNRKTDGNETVRTEGERQPSDSQNEQPTLFDRGRGVESDTNGDNAEVPGQRGGKDGTPGVQRDRENAGAGARSEDAGVQGRPAGERQAAVRNVSGKEPVGNERDTSDSSRGSVQETVSGRESNSGNGERVSDGTAGRKSDESLPGGKPSLRKPVRVEKKREAGDKNLSYVQHSGGTSLESVAPAAMAEAMDAALQKIEKEVGKSIDEFVMDELGYKTGQELYDALAAEQIDSVAMAIYQMKKGSAMIIGDQTGVGKGRQMAALIRWANRQGKKPIFFTQKAGLFSDMYRDLVDVGSSNLRPLIINSVSSDKDNSGVMEDKNGRVVYQSPSKEELKKILESGKVPDGYDYVVLSYSQLSSGDEESRKDSKKKLTINKQNANAVAKARFIRSIAQDNYVLLDESHTAAGADSNSGAFLQSIMPSVKGVTFASATFAKRPDTMPLYAIKSAISQANVEPKDLIQMIERGGVTLQEIMARALTGAGQMVRRERDMSDVKTDWETIDDPATSKRARENYDKAIKIFNDIIAFQNTYISPVIDRISEDIASRMEVAETTRGTENFGADNPPFVNQTYNFTKQLMLALKVDAIVDRVVAEIKAGRHPVIALENTFGSLLDGYRAGDKVEDTSFSAGLIRSLEHLLQYTVREEDGQYQEQLSPEDLGEAGARAYYALQDRIREATADIFMSPLDAITMKLNEQGYKVGEITGRDIVVAKDDSGYVIKNRVKDKKKAVREFNDGTLDVLIINKTGSTGISLHASKLFKDQRQRSMIIAQPLGDINDYMQMIGRIDRTGQVHRGYYINLSLPVPAELRFNMMLATKLKSLNANTTTSQESDAGSVEAPDFLNKYGSQVVVEYLRDHPDIFATLVATGMKFGGKQNAITKSEELEEYQASEDDAQKVTGRVALFPVAEQEAFYNDIAERYNALIKYLDETGENTLKITTLPLKAKTLARKVATEGRDPNGSNPFAQNSYVERVEVDVLKKPMKADEIRRVRESLLNGKTPQQREEELTTRIETQRQARIASENERYERKKEKLQKDIDKQVSAINAKNIPEADKKAEITRVTNRLVSTADVEAEHNHNIAAINNQHDRLRDRFQQFNYDETYLIHETISGGNLFEGAGVPSLFLGFKVAKDGDNLTPSTSFAVFATHDGRRRIEIKFTDGGVLDEISDYTNLNYWLANKTNLANWDATISNATREERYMLTGNILQAWSDASAGGLLPGRLISYTDIDGNIKDGILMNSTWETGSLRSSGKPIDQAREQIENLPWGDVIESTDGQVEIQKSRNFLLRVPKSKKDGAKYFQDERLVSLVRMGDFYQRRGKFEAEVSSENLPAVLQRLSELGVRVADESAENSWEELDQPQANDDIRFREDQTAARVRQKEDPKKTIKVYKLMRLGDDGKLYPLFIDSSAGISIGEWYDAESPDLDFLKKIPSGVFLVNPADGSYTSLEDYANEHGFKAGKFPPKDAINEASVNGMRWVKITDTEKGQRRYEGENRKYENIGINGSGSVSTFAMRPGWHAGSLPTMRQIGKGAQRNLRDDSFVWVEGEVPADVDYNAEAQSNPDNDIPTHIPTDGYYMKSTNANAKAAQADKVGWYVAGSFKANRIISDAEARAVIDEYNAAHPNQEPVEYDYARESGREFKPEERRISAAEREVTNATLDRMSEEMGIKINRVGRSQMPRGHKSDKGYYNPSTGEMTICMDNVTDERDAIATVMHETVGHHGLRKLFGDRFNDAMARIYAVLDQKGRTWVNGYIARHPNADNTRAVEEYLSHLAESGNFKNTVWDNIRRIIGRIVDALFGTNGFLLTDNELNYILRASYENLKNPNWLNTVEGRAFDTLLKRQLGINETDPNKPTDPQGPDAGRLYRDGDSGIASDDYNSLVDSWENKMLTENQDADRPVRIGMDKVMKEKGIKSISEDEDYVTRHNLASSRAESEAHEFELFRFTPLMDQVRAIQSRLLGKKATAADREQAYQRILDYMYAVSGLERNASKNAEIEQAKQAKLADAAAAGITDPAKLAEIEKKYEDMKRDWSGLTSLMGMSKDNWQAAETAAQAMIDAFTREVGDDAALDELWNRVRACTDFSLEHAYQHGLLTCEEFERLHGTASQPRMWDFYLPLRGFNETTTEEQFGYETFTNPSRGNVVVKKMNGRWTQADNPLANILNIAETEIVQGNDNWAKQALYRFTLNAGENTLLSASEPWFVKNPATGKWSLAFPEPDETLEEFEARMKALRALDDPLAKKGRRGLKLENIMANKAHRNEHAIHLKVGGIDKMIWVNGNPALAKAVSGIGRAQNLQWLRRAGRVLSNLFTTYSLDFTAKNLIRDTVYSNIALMVKEDRAYRHQYRKNWIANFGYGVFAFPMVRLAAEWDSGKLQQKEAAGTLTKRERDFLNFMRDGGQTGYTIINSVNQIKKDLEKQMRSAGGRPGTVPVLGWYAKAVKTLNEGFELLTRFTAYQTSRDMGRSGQRAASDAKEISVNFNRRGAQSGQGIWGNIAAYLGATHYFYNAGVQGFDNFLGLFKKKPVKMSVITAGFVIMGILTPLINSMLAGLIGGGDGDDDWYWNLPEWVRRNNLVIGTGKWYVALPLPVEFRAPYGIGDIAGAAFAFDKYPNRKGGDIPFGNLALDIVSTASAIMPVNPIEGYNSNSNIGDAIIRAVAPDAGMFFVDWATNRDYTGRPLWKENPFSETVPRSQGAYASTPKGIVAACQKLAEVSNGNIDIAPGLVRDFMQNYGGGFFRAAEDVSKLLFTDEERPRRWDNVPFFSGFTGHIDEDRSKSFAQNALYEYKNLSEDNVRRMNAILNTDDVTSAVLYDEPESLYEREGVTVLQKAKIKRMLDSKDYSLGKMYREGMNLRPTGRYQYVTGKNGQPRKTEIKEPGVNALRQEWKDLRDQWAKMPDKTEEQKSAKDKMEEKVQEAWHLYYDAMGDLAEKLMDYEYNKQ